MSRSLVTFLPIAVSFLFPGFLSSPRPDEKKPAAGDMLVPACSKPGPDLRRIGSQFGPQFDVPTQQANILGGKTDVDYVRYVIKAKTGDGYLELWFGPSAFSTTPDRETLVNSVFTRERNVIDAGGRKIGRDTLGKFKNGRRWRHTSVYSTGADGARYEAGSENAPLFDKIIDSVCLVPRSQ
jgi:hypothetical protein